MHHIVQEQQHKSNYRHERTAVYVKVMQLHARHLHAEQWSSQHTIRFWRISGHILFQSDVKNLNPEHS